VPMYCVTLLSFFNVVNTGGRFMFFAY